MRHRVWSGAGQDARIEVMVYFADREPGPGKESRRVTVAEWESRPWRDKFLDALAGLLSSQLCLAQAQDPHRGRC